MTTFQEIYWTQCRANVIQKRDKTKNKWTKTVTFKNTPSKMDVLKVQRPERQKLKVQQPNQYLNQKVAIKNLFPMKNKSRKF